VIGVARGGEHRKRERERRKDQIPGKTDPQGQEEGTRTKDTHPMVQTSTKKARL
jgi:hypothetical protein